MPILPYDSSQSLSRYSPIKNWSKLLFRPDRKLQTTEIIELQELLLGQFNKAFDTLYDFYTITRGCKIVIQGITSSNYICSLTDGQVYIDLEDNEGFFIDIKSTNFTINRDEKTSVGLAFYIQVDKDNPLYRNPHDGGSAFGSDGADRLLIKSEVIIDSPSNPSSTGYYPIAIIKPKSPGFVTLNNDIGDGSPDIYYYQNEDLTKVFNNTVLSTKIKNIVERMFYEMAGSFIAEGMYINFDDDTKNITITPGVAYIDGVRVETNYVEAYKLDYEVSSINSSYQVYINKLGEFGVTQTTLNSPYIGEIPANAINLGTILFQGLNPDYVRPKISILPTKSRMPSVQDIILLEQSHEKNKRDLANLSLQIDQLLANSGINQTLNGIIADSFVDLNQTDINNPLFNASILPAIKAITLPFISFQKNSNVFILPISDNTSIQAGVVQDELGQSSFYWATASNTVVDIITQEDDSPNTNILIENYTPGSIENQTVEAFSSPSLVTISDDNSLINYTPPDITLAVETINTGINSVQTIPQTIQQTNINNTFVLLTSANRSNRILGRKVIIKAHGFESNQDNIRMFLNDAPLTNVNFIKGQPGTTSNSARATTAGFVEFSFNLPETVNNKNKFVVNLVGGNTSASTEISVVNPELVRQLQESNNTSIITPSIRYSTVASGVGQTFQIDTPLLLASIQLKLDVEDLIVISELLSDDPVLSVHITTTNNNLPTDETIAEGILRASNFINAQDNPDNPWTTITFDRPSLINTPGTYAFIVNTSLPGLSVRSLDLGNIINTGNTRSAGYLNGTAIKKNSAGTWSILNQDLSFKLQTHQPNTIFSETIIRVANTESYNVLDLNLPIQLSPSSNVEVSILDNGSYQNITNGSYFYREPVLESQIRVRMTGTSTTHPIIELDNTNINLLSHRTKGTWTSINYEFDTPYTFIDLTYDVFQPANSSFTIYISSNKGQTWEEITVLDSSGAEEYLVTTTTINRLVPLEKRNYIIELDRYVQLNQQDVERTNLIVRIDMEVTDLTELPFFKNLIVLTY